MADNLLEVKELSKIFQKKKQQVRAVDDISFKLGYGETIGLVGESGCGKSTTGRLILNLIKPTDGEVLFEGKNVYQYNKKELLRYRKNAQIFFQDCYASLSPRFKVGSLIEESLEIHHIGVNKKERREIAEQVFEDVTLSPELLSRYPHEFSGGQRQRIGIARALCLNPKMIICDEPVSALDVSVQAQIVNLMEDIQDKYKLSYIFISHDLSVVKHMADKIVVMYLGKIVEYGSQKDFFNNPVHPYSQALLAAVPVADPDLKRKKFVLAKEVNFTEYKSGCRFADRCWKTKKICSEVNPEFVDVGREHGVACHCIES